MSRFPLVSLFLASVLLLFHPFGTRGLAQGNLDRDDVLFSADSMSHDQELGIVRAAGNVEISTDQRILRADSVAYNQRIDTVVATGNVAILEPTGEVLFADYVELTDGLRAGFVRSIKLMLADKSRFAASSARRTDGNTTEMTRAVYSACQLCPDNPKRPPLWQIKAVKVIHNQKAQRIDYKDAFLEVYGIPVAYTPYFSHPDPSVKAKSGFLAPRYGSTSELGLRLETPYYVRIAPNRDATITPIVTSKEGVVLGGEYRERTMKGGYIFQGSVTKVDKRDANNLKTGESTVRGHIETNGNFDIDNTWRWGFAASRSTDDTYLRRYNISSDDTQTSNVFLEGFRGRQYASANAYLFQGQREDDDPGTTPVVLPQLEYSFVGEPGKIGDSLRLEASALSLYRSDGQDTRRLSLGGTWQLPYISSGGSVYTLATRLRADGYHVTDKPDLANPGVTESGFRGRLLPSASLDWRLPMVRSSKTTRQIIEPIVAAIVAPYGGNPTGIPNEDSQSFEFDDTNLFSVDRFPGLDRWEGGPRLNFGVKYGAHAVKGGYITAMMGQSYRLKADSTFADKTGLEDKRSDYVGRLIVSPSHFIDYVHRFRLDRDTFSIRRNEIDLALGPQKLHLDIGYLSLDKELTAEAFESREEFRATARARITKLWTADANMRRDLTEDGGALSHGLGLIYSDECIEFTTRFERTFTEDRDVRPSSSISFRVKLKNLG